MGTVYSHIQLHIDGQWVAGGAGEVIGVINPATEEVVGTVAKATTLDLDRALKASSRGFNTWRRVSAFERCKIMCEAARLVRQRSEAIAHVLTLENGKPIAQARMETLATADMIDWFAEEGRRVYGRVIPARATNVQQLSLREPVGPVAAFTPWNFPLSQVVKKLAAALGTGCSIIIKAAEETPASPAALVQAFVDAGVPAGVIGLVFGVPAQISEYLISHPIIRKVSFTGSTAIGKNLAALAGQHMKRATMELGGHAPAIVFKDADVDTAALLLSSAKFRNAGQVCISPTRLLVHSSVFEDFADQFVRHTKALKVGNGLDESVTMGPLTHERRRTAVETIIEDAVRHGATLLAGGSRVGNEGYFIEPTVLVGTPTHAAAMQTEVFGPVALIMPFDDFDAAVAEANRLPYGLAAYAYTRSAKTAADVAAAMETGMISINHNGLSLSETPFGGVKDSGYGSEGGSEGVEPYVVTKFVSQVGA